MTNKRLIINLTGDEHEWLRKNAKQHCRKPNQQARFLVLQGLGLTQPEFCHTVKNSTGACEFADRSASAIQSTNQF
ncbi:MAG: hypothetical protein H6641_18410 [Caldilineaceae bacterium]|nr:hypothetical protein [Caldilineaceae bacterium]